MTLKKDKKVEAKKIWLAPALKRITIDEITAHSPSGPHADGNHSGFGS